MKKDFSFAMTVFILVESSILLVLQFALDPNFRNNPQPQEITVSFNLPRDISDKYEECECPEITCQAVEIESEDSE